MSVGIPIGPPSPTLAQVIADAIAAAMFDMHTGLPARVVSFDAQHQACSVQPLLQRVYQAADGTMQTLDLPSIDNVPVCYPAGGGWSITWPLAAGDIVYLAFAERSIDAWLASPRGQTVDPALTRRFDLSDAVAVAQLRPRTAPLAVDPANLRIGREDGSVQLELSTTAVHVKAPQVFLDAGGDADAEMVRGAALANWILQVQAYLQALVLPVSGVSAGPPAAPAPGPPADLLSAAAKLK